MSVKSILLKNNGLVLQPKRWALADQESGSQVLQQHSESNYSNPSSVAEVEEGLRVWATILSRIRAWSYEGWALVNAMADVSYFLTVQHRSRSPQACENLGEHNIPEERVQGLPGFFSLHLSSKCSLPHYLTCC